MAKAGNAAEKDLVSKLGNDVKGVKNVENQMTIEEVTMKDKRKGYELDAQLEEWNAQIALLKAKADNGKKGLTVFADLLASVFALRESAFRLEFVLFSWIYSA